MSGILFVGVILKKLLMYSLLNVGRLYLVLGFISILVYFNIPDEMNKSTMAVWILGLSLIYFVLGITRLIKHYKDKSNSKN
jgi:phosphotransferase system  glucose/maltose/N-acetylglucosamine-specific IIC component